MKDLNGLLAKFAPDNFHWAVVHIAEAGHAGPANFPALDHGQHALSFGTDSDCRFITTLARRCPSGIHGGGRAVSGVPRISAILRSHLAESGFRLGQRGMARTRHAGQYAPQL